MVSAANLEENICESKALALMRKAFGYFMDYTKRLLGLEMEITMRSIFLYKLYKF